MRVCECIYVWKIYFIRQRLNSERTLFIHLLLMQQRWVKQYKYWERERERELHELTASQPTKLTFPYIHSFQFSLNLTSSERVCWFFRIGSGAPAYSSLPCVFLDWGAARVIIASSPGHREEIFWTETQNKQEKQKLKYRIFTKTKENSK